MIDAVRIAHASYPARELGTFRRVHAKQQVIICALSKTHRFTEPLCAFLAMLLLNASQHSAARTNQGIVSEYYRSGCTGTTSRWRHKRHITVTSGSRDILQ